MSHRVIANATLDHAASSKEPFHMPAAIAIERGLSLAGARRTVYRFLRLRAVEVIFVVWAITALLIAAVAAFDGQPFLGAFDVSVAAF